MGEEPAPRAAVDENVIESEGEAAEELEDGEIPEDSTEESSAAIQPHPLEYSWTFWLDNPSGGALSDSFTPSTLSRIFGGPMLLLAYLNLRSHLYNNIHHPSNLVVGADFYCFKHKIEPKWENPVCANGGKWTISCARGKSDTLWLYTLLAMIGELFDLGDEICGAVVNVRGKQGRIALCTKNAANEAS